MTLRSTGRSRERVLLFGMEGVGKSLAALDVAAAIAPARLHVIDNDNAWDRMLEGQTLAGEDVRVAAEYRWNATVEDWEFDGRWCVEGGNVVVYHANGWVANTKAIEAVREDADPDDWCCIDSGSALWDDVQAWFTMSVFDSSMSDYFLKIRMEKAAAAKDAKALGAFDGWVDWPVINATYKEHVMAFLVTPPCHLLVTCEQADVTKEETDKETRALYGGENVKPRGQKRIGHNVQTVVRLRRDRSDMYYATTVKDRGGRERLENEDVTGRGFAEWYLEEVGGWQESGAVATTTKPQSSGSSSGSGTIQAKSGPVSKAPVTKTPIVKKG